MDLKYNSCAISLFAHKRFTFGRMNLSLECQALTKAFYKVDFVTAWCVCDRNLYYKDFRTHTKQDK